MPGDDRQFILLSELINQYLRFDDFIKDSRVQKVSEGTDPCSMGDVFEAIRVMCPKNRLLTSLSWENLNI